MLLKLKAKVQPEPKAKPPVILWVQVIRPDANTHAPRDEDWFEARIKNRDDPAAVHFDKMHGRFYNGKGHAVAEHAIVAWRRA